MPGASLRSPKSSVLLQLPLQLSDYLSAKVAYSADSFGERDLLPLVLRPRSDAFRSVQKSAFEFYMPFA